MHKISDEFEFRLDRTTDYGVSCPWASKKFPYPCTYNGKNAVSMPARSFLIESSSKMLVTRTGIKARTCSMSGLWFPWPIYMFFEMRFDLGTSDSGERSLPFGLLVDYAYRLFAALNDPTLMVDSTNIILLKAFRFSMAVSKWSGRALYVIMCFLFPGVIIIGVGLQSSHSVLSFIMGILQY